MQFFKNFVFLIIITFLFQCNKTSETKEIQQDTLKKPIDSESVKKDLSPEKEIHLSLIHI